MSAGGVFQWEAVFSRGWGLLVSTEYGVLLLRVTPCFPVFCLGILARLDKSGVIQDINFLPFLPASQTYPIHR